MKQRILFAIFILACLVAFLTAKASAQEATVSATITDATGQAFANGTWRADLTRPAGLSLGTPNRQDGVPLVFQFSGNLDSTGTFSSSMPRTDKIVPSGFQWTFTICSAATAGCFNSVQTLTGGVVDLSAALSTAAGTITVKSPAYSDTNKIIPRAYKDSEMVNPSIGALYYNITSGIFRSYDGTQWNDVGNAAALYVYSGFKNLDVVCTGDSICGNAPDGTRWPDKVIALPGLLGRVSGNAVTYKGYSGEQCSQIQGHYNTDTHPLSPVVTGHKGILFVQCGTNDQINATTAATSEAAITTLLTAARADGWKILMATVMPVGVTTLQSQDIQRQSLNSWIRTQLAAGNIDYLADWDTLVQNPFDTNNMLSDGTHPNDSTRKLMALMIDQELRGVGAPKVGTKALYVPQEVPYWSMSYEAACSQSGTSGWVNLGTLSFPYNAASGTRSFYLDILGAGGLKTYGSLVFNIISNSSTLVPQVNTWDAIYYAIRNDDVGSTGGLLKIKMVLTPGAINSYTWDVYVQQFVNNPRYRLRGIAARDAFAWTPNITCNAVDPGVDSNTVKTVLFSVLQNSTSNISTTGSIASGPSQPVTAKTFATVNSDGSAVSTIAGGGPGNASTFFNGGDFQFTVNSKLQWRMLDGQFLLPASGVATAGANFNPYASHVMRSSYWNGASASNDDWSFTVALGSGTNPTSTLTLGHIGSTNNSIIFLVPSIRVQNHVFNNTGMQHGRVSTGSIGATTRSEILLTWGTTWADTNYTVVCSVEDSTTAAGTQGLTIERLKTKSTTQMGVIVNNPTAGALTGSIDCNGMHD